MPVLSARGRLERPANRSSPITFNQGRLCHEVSMRGRAPQAGRIPIALRAGAQVGGVLLACAVAGAAGVAIGERRAAAAGATHAAEDDAQAPKAPAPAPYPEIERYNTLTRGEAPADWQPPAEFQADVLATVDFASMGQVQRLCGAGTRSCERMEGTRRVRLVVANPCKLSYFDAYAVDLCHELGHANGWPADHVGGHWAKIPPPGGYVLTITRPDGAVRWRGFVAGGDGPEVAAVDTLQGGSGSAWRAGK
jgi:hypothetical protein